MIKLSDGTSVDIEDLKAVWDRVKGFMKDAEIYSPDALEFPNVGPHLVLMCEDIFEIIGYPEPEPDDNDRGEEDDYPE